MPPHTPVGKRVRSVTLGSVETVLNGVTQDKVAATHQFEDDVRVIGFQIGCEAEILDATVNADGEFNMITELSRSGQRSQPGSLGRNEIHGTWSAAIVVAGPSRDIRSVIFPEGYGYDFDVGDVLNLLCYLTYIGGVVSIPMYPEAVVYYVER